MTTTRPRGRVADVMRQFEGRDRIPLSELLGPLGVDRDERYYLVGQGLIEPLPERGKRNAYQVDPAEAERLAEAALVAASACVALAIVLRILRVLAG